MCHFFTRHRHLVRRDADSTIGESGAAPSGDGSALYFGLCSVACWVTFPGHLRKRRSAGDLGSLGKTIEWRGNLAKRSIPWLIRRLRQAGFGSEFVSAAILPDWWDQSCLNQPELLPEIEIRVGRFLAVPLSTVSDPESPLEPLGYPGARLRCVRDIGRDRLAPAIHAAMRIAGAVVRNLKEPVPARTPPPFRRTRVAPRDPGSRRQLGFGRHRRGPVDSRDSRRSSPPAADTWFPGTRRSGRGQARGRLGSQA